MVNLYQLLGLDMQATPEAIQAAIAREQALGNINPEVLEKASAWLLDAPTRARYDAQLRSSDASLWGGISTRSASSSMVGSRLNTCSKSWAMRSAR